jgi:DNA replication protein DnaC
MGNPETSQAAPSTASKGGVDLDFAARPRKQSAEATVTTEKALCATCGSDCEQRVTTYPGGTVSRWPKTPICNACSEAAARKAREERLAKELSEAREFQDFEWSDQSGIEKMGVFLGKTLAEFERGRQPRAYDAVAAWNGKSLILASPGAYGVGKTHLVCALTAQLLTGESAKIVGDRVRKFPCPVFVTNEARLIGRVRQTFNRHNDDEENAETEETIYRSLLQPDLLIIDDVGKVRPRDLSFLQGVYYRIIDDRYIEEKAVILTTNLSLEELEQHIGGACSDRLREMCGKDRIIVMAGQSYRREK